VLGRSPRNERPPANYQLVYQGRYYDVWRRTATPQVIEDSWFGNDVNPAKVPSCSAITAIAQRASRDGATLAYFAAPRVPMLIPTQAQHPAQWPAVDGDPTELIPNLTSGAITGKIHVHKTGRYEVWLDGSFGQRFDVWVNRQHVGSVTNQLGPPGQAVLVGDANLTAGDDPVLVIRSDGGIRPGLDSDYPINRLVGPLMLAPAGSSPAVAEIDPAQARSLCGHSLEWVEIVR
jgi:hypothetical protein